MQNFNRELGVAVAAHIEKIENLKEEYGDNYLENPEFDYQEHFPLEQESEA